MKRAHTIGLWMIMTVLVLTLIPLPSQAANLVVQVSGTTISSPADCMPGNPDVEVIISGCDGAPRNYGSGAGSFSISKATDSGPCTNPKNACVITTEGSDDKLGLKNAKIVALQNAASNCNAYSDTSYTNCPTIFMSASFAQPPQANGSPVPYYRESFGSMKRGANPASGSSFRINGWVNDLDGTGGDNQVGYEQKKSICSTAGCESVNLSQQEDWLPVSLQSDRELKAQFWFTLKYANASNPDTLTLSSLHVSTTPGGGLGKGARTLANDPDETHDGRGHGK